jgi:hypothetical protein
MSYSVLRFLTRHQVTQQSLVTPEAAVTNLTGFRGNWISFLEHIIIIGKAGLNLFCNETCLCVVATLEFRQVAGQRETRFDGWINGQIERAV